MDLDDSGGCTAAGFGFSYLWLIVCVVVSRCFEFGFEFKLFYFSVLVVFFEKSAELGCGCCWVSVKGPSPAALRSAADGTLVEELVLLFR